MLRLTAKLKDLFLGSETAATVHILLLLILCGVLYLPYLGNTPWVKERKPEWTDLEYQLRNWMYFTWLSGFAMLAVVQNPNAARLMGINVSGAIAASYAVSAVLAGVAALLIAPLFNVSSEMGTLFGIKAFAAAIIGGLGSAWGVMLAGLCLGLIEVFATNYLGSVYTQIITFASVIIILVVLPHGLLGRAGVKKV